MSEHDEFTNSAGRGRRAGRDDSRSSRRAGAQRGGRVRTRRRRNKARTCPRSSSAVLCMRSRTTDRAPRDRKRFAASRLAAGGGDRARRLSASAQACLVMNDHRQPSRCPWPNMRAKPKRLQERWTPSRARLIAIENAKSHDELVELRRSVGEIRSGCRFVSGARQRAGAALAAGGEARPRGERKGRQTRRAVRPRSRAPRPPNCRRVSRSSRRRPRGGRDAVSNPAAAGAGATETACRCRRSSARMSPWRRPALSNGRDRSCAAMSCSALATMSP